MFVHDDINIKHQGEGVKIQQRVKPESSMWNVGKCQER